jgi:hypothetical protein
MTLARRNFLQASESAHRPIVTAYLKYPSAHDAFRALKAQTVDDPQIKRALHAALKPVLAALGPSAGDGRSYRFRDDGREVVEIVPQDEDRKKAWSGFEEWLGAVERRAGKKARLGDENPELAVAAELSVLVPEILTAYFEPLHFFNIVVPERYPGWGMVELWSSRILLGSDPLSIRRDVALLGHLLQDWGFAALLNETVSHVFQTATRNQLLRILTIAEDRRTFREGAPKGTPSRRKGVRRPDVAATEQEVYAEARRWEWETGAQTGGVTKAVRRLSKAKGVKEETLRKRIYPRKPK